MSLFLFMLGVAGFYFLYVSYNNSEKSSKENLKDTENVTVTDYGENYYAKFGILFKRFISRIADPTNNNFVVPSSKAHPFLFRSLVDRFKTFDDVVNAMKEAGLGRCRLILGIDFTASNEWQGRSTHKGYSLHNISSTRLHNPYQNVITALQHTLKDFIDVYDDSFTLGNAIVGSKKTHSGIPSFGFGDTLTKDHSTFPLRSDGLSCNNFQDVMRCYKECVSKREFSGPTSYAPIINKAIEIVEKSNHHHILVIIADGQFVNKGPTMQAIVDASHYALSIVVVGVGDGPWSTMHQFDDWLPQRQFDNFQFVEYEKILKSTTGKNFEALLALHMLMEIPDQYKMVHQLGYIEKANTDKKLQVER